MKKIPLIITLKMSEEEANVVLHALRYFDQEYDSGTRHAETPDQIEIDTKLCQLMTQVADRLEKDL